MPASLGRSARCAEGGDALHRGAVARTCGSSDRYAARVPDDREPTDADLDELRGLEAAMWRSETRGDRSWMEQHLAMDFDE